MSLSVLVRKTILVYILACTVVCILLYGAYRVFGKIGKTSVNGPWSQDKKRMSYKLDFKSAHLGF